MDISKVERLFVILSVLSLVGENFYCAIQHWIRTNKKKRNSFSRYYIFILFFFHQYTFGSHKLNTHLCTHTKAIDICCTDLEIVANGSVEKFLKINNIYHLKNL